MNCDVLVTPLAEDDLGEIYAWIAQDAPYNAARFHDRLLDAILSLANDPDRCPLAPENANHPGTVRHLILDNYRIVFRRINRKVFVLHIRHGARERYNP
jgi:plasmid stabilization system protein ParE